MRYLVSKKKEESIKGRQQYIFDVFNLYTIRKESDESNFIELDSFPLDDNDFLFIIGHDNEVLSYLTNSMEEIHEKNIVIISCNTRRLRKIRKINNSNKNIFIPKTDIITFYKGDKWNFLFDITDKELDIYNSKHENILNVLLSSMEKL